MKIFYSFIFIVFGMTTYIFSQVPFTTHTITTDANGANSVYAVDVDGDGDVDVLSASRGDDKIAWYENDGDENFTQHTITTSASGAYSVYAADVDGDGDMDVLSASQDDDKIAWYENDGNENFTSHTITTGMLEAYSVYAEDVDGDGDMDVLSGGAPGITWYENDGNENFTSHTITASSNGAYSVYSVDVDGDGDKDVVSASRLYNEIAWYENDGNENFTSHTIPSSVFDVRSVYAEDVDGDGDMDVLSASIEDDKIAWYENDGNENFTSHTITIDADGALAVYAEDVDGDGDMDVLCALWFDNEIAWYENDGNENFTHHTITADAVGAYSVYAADIDSDGDMDVVSASYYDDKIAWYENLISPFEFDIKPQSCPNPLNVKSKGKIPVAILGMSEFDVMNIDPATLLLEGIAPIRWAIEDVATPLVGGEQCDCTTDGSDGFDDLTLKFNTQELVAALGSINNGDELELFITGYLLDGTPIEGSDCVIIKAKGNLGGDLTDNPGQVPEDYSLFDNFPDPFNPVTTISYGLPIKAQVELVVYNTLGESVVQLVNEEKEAGRYEVKFDATKLPSGIYFYRLRASSFMETKKMILLK
jgi:hypothetical protein